MKSFREFREIKSLDIGYDTLISEVMYFFGIPYEKGIQPHINSFYDWQTVNEEVSSTRYSIEINYRTNINELLKEYAKIVLGFVSAAMKNFGYHVKHVYDEPPIRILVSSRKWDDGEWVSIISWNPHQNCFVLSKGFYNKDRKSTSIQSSQKCAGDSASELAREMRNMMHDLKDKTDRHQDKLKPVPMKRGPKR